MEFEWNEEKSQKTKIDRGIDFNDAAKIWLDPDSLEIPVFSANEVRWAKIGMLNDHLHTVIFTIRSLKIRIISARRSHPKEIRFYEQK